MNEQEITTEIATLNSSVLMVRVTDSMSYKAAAGFLIEVKGMEKVIRDFFEPLKKKAHDSHKALTTSEKEELEKLKPVEDHLKREINAYNAEQERIRAAEQKRLDDLRAAEQKKIDDARKAEEVRLEAERKAEQARLDAIAAAERKAEEDRRVAAAAKAKAEGDAAEAARIAALPPPVVVAAVAAPVAVLPPAPVIQRTVVQSSTPKVAGVSTKTVWLFEVTDQAAVPREFLMVDERRIREFVQTLKESAKIPGVRIYSEQQVAAGSRS